MKMKNSFGALVALLLIMYSVPQIEYAQTAQAWFVRGGTALGQGRYNEAVDAFNQVIRMDSVLRPRAYSLLAMAHEANKNYESAIAAYKKAIELRHSVHDNSLRLASLLLTLNRPDEAMPILRDAVEAKPDDLQSQLLLIRVYTKQAKDSEAEQRLNLLLKSNPLFSAGIVELIRLYIQLHRYDDAKGVILSTRVTTDEFVEAAIEVARVYENEKRLPDAETICGRLLEIKPPKLDAYVELAQIYARSGRETNIEKIIPALKNVDDKYLQGYVDIARRLDAANKPDDAEKIFKRMLQERPDFFRASAELARMYVRRGKVDKALEQIELVSLRHSFSGVPDPDWNYEAAKVHLQVRDYSHAKEYSARAVEQYQEAMKSNSNSAILYAKVGLCNLMREELAAAEGEFQKYINRTQPGERSSVQSELEDMIGLRVAQDDAKYILKKYFSQVGDEKKDNQAGLANIPVSVRDTVAPIIVIQEPKEAHGMKIVETQKYAIQVSGLAADENGVGVVYINDIVGALNNPTSAEISESGLSGKVVKFTADAMLSVGENSVDVRAVDVNGNQAKVVFKVRRVTPEPLSKKEERPAEPKLKLPQLWAVIVGISEYQDKELQLSFAHKDAQAYYSFLKSPYGGAIPDDRIELLTNRNATRADIIRALNEKLRMAFEDDVVIIYIASHGVPDDVSGELYFLGYDADPKNIAGTAISQIDVQKAISTARAKKIIFIADACHSGSVGLSSNIARRGTVASYVNRLLKEIATARDGVAILTASSSNEFSQEGAQWGGHGVFTNHLINGLKGEADGDGDGYVTIRELYEYVYRKVAEDTDGKQHPDLQGKFDNNLPMSVVK